MKPKSKRAKSEPAATRNSLAKKIAAQPTIEGKLSVLAGYDITGKMALDSKLGLSGFLESWRQAAIDAKQFPKLYSTPVLLDLPVKQLLKIDPNFGLWWQRRDMLELGCLIATALMERNHTLFSQIAAGLYYDNAKPETHKLYNDILRFCNLHSCGTQKRPCDPAKLTCRLKAGGHKFGDAIDNQTPTTLRVVCQKLGVILESKRAIKLRRVSESVRAAKKQKQREQLLERIRKFKFHR
jgi:hypothetical protein